VNDILAIILKYREARGWTEYRLAQESELPQSTISNWYCNNSIPSLLSLEKICKAYDITLSQLFAEGDTPVTLTESQKRLLEHWSKLNAEQQNALLNLLEKM